MKNCCLDEQTAAAETIRKLQKKKKREVRQQHELHTTRNANYGKSHSEVAWVAIACAWLRALILSSYARRDLRAIRPASTFTAALEKQSRRPARQHQELSDACRCIQDGHAKKKVREQTRVLNASWISTKLCLLNFPLIFNSWKTKSAVFYSSTYNFFLLFFLCSYLQWQGHALHLDCTLSRLGNITMRGSAERIYTTTYYIPSSPIEVRAYYPGYYSKESWPKDNLEYSKFNFTTEYRLNQKRKGSPEQPRVYRHEFLQTRVLQTRVLTDTSFITWWL